MWVGGYDDWTPAEQREWDRDIAELEAQREEGTLEAERKEKELRSENEENLHWLELAIDDPLYKVTYTRVFGSNMYVMDITQHSPSKEGARNLDFEVMYPMYHGLTDIIEKRKTLKTTEIKIEASSREHWDVTYTCEFSPKQWSYSKMDEIMYALAEQLTMKQNLNRGLMMSLSFHKE